MGSTVITDQNILGISVTSKPMMSEKKMASPMFSVMDTPKTAGGIKGVRNHKYKVPGTFYASPSLVLFNTVCQLDQRAAGVIVASKHAPSRASHCYRAFCLRCSRTLVSISPNQFKPCQVSLE